MNMLHVYTFATEQMTKEEIESLKSDAISRFLGVAPTGLQFARTKQGKPYLMNYPRIHFNLSHTTGHMLLAISDDGELGVDIEEVSAAPPYEIVDVVFGEGEKAYLNDACGHKQKRFYELWTKKEAYLKYLGIGFLVETPQEHDVLRAPGNFFCFMLDNCQCAVYYEMKTEPVLYHSE